MDEDLRADLTEVIEAILTTGGLEFATAGSESPYVADRERLLGEIIGVLGYHGWGDYRDF